MKLPSFQWSAINPEGEVVRGILEAADRAAVVERLQLSKGGQSMDDVIDSIRLNMSVQPVPDLSQIGTTAIKKKPGQGSPVPGFYLNFTASTPREAQAVCSELTSLMITDNGKFIDAAAAGTSDAGRPDAPRPDRRRAAPSSALRPPAG